MASDRDIRLLQAWLDAGSPTTDAGVPILDDDVWPDLPYPDIHVAVSPEAVDEVMAIAPPDPDITGGELTTGYVSEVAKDRSEPPPGYIVQSRHNGIDVDWYWGVDLCSTAPHLASSHSSAVANCWAHRDAVLASARPQGGGAAEREFISDLAAQHCCGDAEGSAHDYHCPDTGACITEWCWPCRARALLATSRPPVGGEPGTWVWKGDKERMDDAYRSTGMTLMLCEALGVSASAVRATALSRGRKYAGAAQPEPVSLPEGARWTDSVPCASVGLLAAAVYSDETDCIDVWVYVDADGLHIQATADRGHEVVDIDPRGARIDVVRAVLARAEDVSDA